MRTCSKEIDERVNIEIIKNLISKGKNVREIAKIIGVNAKTLSYRLQKLKLIPNTIRYILDINHTFFDLIDSEEKAYILGYILADGYIGIEPKKKNGKIYSYSKRLCFSSSIDDFEVLDLIRSKICPNSKMKHIFNTKGAILRKEQISLRISSRTLIDILIEKYKIIPRKTYDTTFEFPFETIPEELQRHFIRGFFDGDGCKGGTKKFAGNINFCFTSEIFMNQIINWFKNIIPEITYNIQITKGKTVKYYKLLINLGNGVHNKVFSLFYDYSKYFLNRKYIKFYKQNTVVSSVITKGSETP